MWDVEGVILCAGVRALSARCLRAVWHHARALHAMRVRSPRVVCERHARVMFASSARDLREQCVQRVRAACAKNVEAKSAPVDTSLAGRHGSSEGRSRARSSRFRCG